MSNSDARPVCEECPRFEGCNAQICPLDPETLKNCNWYPDEEICRNREFSKLGWIRTQRKLSRRAVPEFYFTYQMLKHKFRICKGIKGLDPNKSADQEPTELKKWFNVHPELKKQELTPEQIERLKRMRDLKKRGSQTRKLEKSEVC